jgi:CheY-like chemotaxis protein
LTQTALWVDDHRNSIQRHATMLQKSGIKVDWAQDSDAALRMAAGQHYEAIWVDCRLGRKSGVKLIQDLRKILPRCRFAAVTSFRSKYADMIDALSFKVPIIEKPIVSTTDEDMRFVRSLRDTFSSKNSRGAAFGSLSRALIAPDINPFDVTSDEYFSMTVTEQSALLEKAEIILQPILDSTFRSGQAWVVFCGDPTEPRLSRSGVDNGPRDAELVELSKRFDRAPFVFSAPVQIDDLWSIRCSSESGSLQGYPTVTIDIGNYPNKSRLNIHFDTGSPHNYMSLESLRAGSPEMIGKITARHYINGSKYSGPNFEGQSHIVDQENDATKGITFRGIALHEWTDCVLARKCSSSACQNENRREDGVCVYRVGLVGRSLVLENRLAITLDGETGKTRLATLRRQGTATRGKK